MIVLFKYRDGTDCPVAQNIFQEYFSVLRLNTFNVLGLKYEEQKIKQQGLIGVASYIIDCIDYVTRIGNTARPLLIMHACIN